MVKSKTKCLINHQVHTNRIVDIVKHTQYNTFNAVVVLALVLCFFVSSVEPAEGLRVSGAFKPSLPDVAPQVKLAFTRPYIFEYKVYLPRTTSVERDKFHSISTIGPQKIGIHRDLPERYQGELKHSLTWRKRDDGIVAYLLVHSPDAESVRFLADLSLPVGASLNFYEITTTSHIRVIHSFDVDEPGLDEPKFWSPIAFGESIGVEIRLPDEASKAHFELKLLKIAHGYERSFTAATNVQECTNHIDVQCAIDDGDISEESVSTSMRLRYESEGGTYACSGTILNVPNDGEDVWIPYIMTAEHCISTSAEADSVVAYWNYQYEQCGGTSLSSDYTSTPGGADLLATYPEGDQTLIRLRNDAPAGTFFSGWWVTDVESGETGICSGHPTPGIKKFFSGTTTGNFDVNVCADEDGNDCELLIDLIELELENGAIEGGASGSALRINHPEDNEDYFVGVLSAKSTDHPPCEGGVGYFGEFRHFYPDVAQWLGAETEPEPEPDDIHGDTEDTATVVELQSGTEGYINDENDIDYFEVTVEQAGTLVIYTTGSIDTTGSVTNEDGSVDLTDEDSGNDLNFLISFTADPGTYSIKVEGNQSSTGSYILVVEFEVHNEQNDDLDDHGDTEDTATPLELDSTTVGEIDDEEDIDYFEIVIDRAGTLKIYTTGDLDTTGTVTNEDGTVDIFDDDSGADLNFSITLDADVGTYFIKVEGYSTSTGEYTLHTEFEAHDDHGDTKESATTISSSARNWKFSTVAYINDAFDQDVFELVFSRKTKTTIYTEGETDTVGRLTNLNDVDIVEDDDICDENDEDCEENLNFSLTYTVDKGTYYLYVSGEITEKSEYTLKVETDADQVSE
ncbi:MAG: hypothetical protein OXH84_06310 [Gammaproteobacteria bacterium]|nr:hypothetical protein [Gammaproteobacteria bacterium]